MSDQRTASVLRRSRTHDLLAGRQRSDLGGGKVQVDGLGGSEVRAVVEEQRTSGLTVFAFCSARGIAALINGTRPIRAHPSRGLFGSRSIGWRGLLEAEEAVIV